MTTIDSSSLLRCSQALDQAPMLLQQSTSESISYESYRPACVKEFKIIIELAGKLPKKALRPYYASHRQAEALVYKDIFRAATQHGLLSTLKAERWLTYRDSRNNTAHDHGAGFAEAAVTFLPRFVTDATALAQLLHGKFINS